MATLLTNPRFNKGGSLNGWLALFLGVVAAVLATAFRRSRRMVAEIDREIAVLGKGVKV